MQICNHSRTDKFVSKQKTGQLYTLEGMRLFSVYSSLRRLTKSIHISNKRILAVSKCLDWSGLLQKERIIINKALQKKATKSKHLYTERERERERSCQTCTKNV